MKTFLITSAMLICSNVFMTFAWYGHLHNMKSRPWFIAAIVSWAIALGEYLIQVPANRIGHEQYNVGQLKILQEAITLMVFVPFSILYLKEEFKTDYIWAGLCIIGAVYFIFRSH
ncbi:MAG: DMT family protein [Sedimentisphaerales bacterium]|nr:DMT family protein [Sedimentisphaerales bacterium]MBN2842077.1 DMT family protein [Sedimentisphaerales bacterium]